MSSKSDNSHSSVKLPKLTIEPFVGDMLHWQQFYDSFSTSVDKNESLCNVEKFNYLRSYLRGPALRMLDGIPITNENYVVAMTLLQKKYGDKSLTVSAHISKVLNMNSVPDVTSKLEQFFDELERHLRTLDVLGMTETQVLAQSVLSKLPQRIREKILKVVNGNQEHLMMSICEVLESDVKFKKESEVKFRKASEFGIHAFSREDSFDSVGQDSSQNTKFRPHFGHSVVSYVGYKRNVVCFYCSENHRSFECSRFPDFQSRSKCVNERGACYRCLRGNHESKDCYSRRACQYCQSMAHNDSLCPDKFRVRQAHAMIATVEPKCHDTKQSDRVENIHIGILFASDICENNIVESDSVLVKEVDSDKGHVSTEKSKCCSMVENCCV